MCQLQCRSIAFLVCPTNASFLLSTSHNVVVCAPLVVCWNQFARDHRILLEPACGAALAVLYSDRLRREFLAAAAAGAGEGGPIVVQLCGGSGVSLELLQHWKSDLAL